MADFGLEPTLDSAFHRFACSITPQWITTAIDGVETWRWANPFAGKRWYPIIDVAVKAPQSDPYDQGNGFSTVRALRVWRT